MKDSLSSYIRKSIRFWDVKNCGVVIVQGDSTLFRKGFSYKTFSKIEDETQFPLASVSKHFTSLMLLKVLRDNNISINSNIFDYIENDSLKKNFLRKNITFKDLLNHNLGFKNYEKDFYLFENRYSKKEILEKVYSDTLPSKKSYGYHNAGYILIGELIETISGVEYEDYLKEEFLYVLKMFNTHADYNNYISDIKNVDFFKGKKNIKVKSIQSNKFKPAGGIYSTLKDMDSWIKYLLKEPNPLLSRVFDTIYIKNETHPYNKDSKLNYQLGLKTQYYSGKKIYFHYGGLPGIVTALYLIPEIEVGFFIFCNKNNTPLTTMISYEILDSFLSLPYRNYSMWSKSYHDKMESKNELEHQIQNNKIINNNILGKYKNVDYGEIKIIQKESEVVLLFENHGELKATLDYNDDVKLIFKTNSLIYPKILIEKKQNEREIELSFFESDPHKYKFVRL
ncbi:serine hydrolase domain-containing protein [Tenacibaculum sp. TC6]|uniref:serine hydrolase domain-containing protein n=1 Tax=Tenacibaculum sp. TC6 TaxID=3423223 RepID=UPI003D364A76